MINVLNYEKYNDKCFKKDELPKNVFFNYETQLYELCYDNCESCIKAGNYSENNCLTCKSNFIKEPLINSTNCVDKCKYLYYYDSINQYSCTEEEQCPFEASLIIINV